jgi:hypothetical protein
MSVDQVERDKMARVKNNNIFKQALNKQEE